MKILILADLHMEFAPFDAATTDADVVILAGDTDLNIKGVTWAKETFLDKPVIFVPGNHEYYGEEYQELRVKMQEVAAGSNVHVLDGDKYEQDGVVFLGATLWTDFSLLNNRLLAMLAAQSGVNDFKRIRMVPAHKRFLPEEAIRSHFREKDWLEKELQAAAGRKIVVVTHHLPSIVSVPERYRHDIVSAAFASNLDNLVAQSGAVLWVHGHTHTACDYMLGETRVLCNPRGYPHESSGFKFDLTVEI